MDIKLKNCPFCGSEAVEIEGISDPFAGAKEWVIICSGCMSAFFDSRNVVPCSKAELIDRWNRRTGTERISGKWISDDYGYNRCSECGYEHDHPEEKTLYCPGCGAYMDPES